MNIKKAMSGNLPDHTSTNNNNTPKVETVDESDAKEDENENKKAMQDKERFELQVNSPLTAEHHVWEASRRHELRPCRQPSFDHRYPSDHYTNLMVHIFTQLNLKQVLKRFGKTGMKATKSEMQQMHNKVVFHPIKGDQITKKKNGALQVLMFLKQKRCGKIKGRVIAEGRKQR